MKRKYDGDVESQSILDALRLEMDMHRKYADYYGYAFYLMSRPCDRC